MSNLPVQGTVTSGYGKRIDPRTKKEKMHYGIDIAANLGTDLLSNITGIIKFAGEKGDYGNLVIIESNGIEQRFGHLNSINVKTGQNISKGDLLGEIGHSGYATGNHLHWEVLQNGKYIDPMSYKPGVSSWSDTISKFFSDITSTGEKSVLDLSFAQNIVINTILVIALILFIALLFFPGFNIVKEVVM